MERTPQTLAGMLEERVLVERPEVSFKCESKEEALALANELTDRGWQTAFGQALTFNGTSNVMELSHIVSIEGRRADG